MLTAHYSLLASQVEWRVCVNHPHPFMNGHESYRRVINMNEQISACISPSLSGGVCGGGERESFL